jgi:hypothetical protein
MVEAAREEQPAGPYRLGGHYFGGLVAFEKVRQLLRADHAPCAACGQTPPGSAHLPGSTGSRVPVIEERLTSRAVMTTDPIERPFDSIESAQAFMDILAWTILDVMTELGSDHQIALREAQERRARAIALAIFKLKTLGCYVHKSRRALKDLRTLRRLILNERPASERVVGPT